MDAARLEVLGSGTAGVASLTDTRAAGLTDAQRRWLLASGRWQSPYPRVFVTLTGPLPPLTRLFAALAYAGPGAALSHQTAGGLWGITRPGDAIHVTVPLAWRPRPQPGLVFHRSSSLGDNDVHPVLAPTRTRVERTVLDLLAISETVENTLALVADALRNRTTQVRLREALKARPRTRRQAAVSDALPDLRAGAQSLLELRDAAMRRAHGLPMGTRQARRLGDGAEYLDVLIEEWGLHLEYDGRLGHDRGREIWRDMRRDNRSEVLGLRHLRYGWADVAGRPCAVALQQAEVLRQQGWPGPFRRCRSCPPA